MVDIGIGSGSSDAVARSCLAVAAARWAGAIGGRPRADANARWADAARRWPGAGRRLGKAVQQPAVRYALCGFPLRGACALSSAAAA